MWSYIEYYLAKVFAIINKINRPWDNLRGEISKNINTEWIKLYVNYKEKKQFNETKYLWFWQQKVSRGNVWEGIRRNEYRGQLDNLNLWGVIYVFTKVWSYTPETYSFVSQWYLHRKKKVERNVRRKGRGEKNRFLNHGEKWAALLRQSK